MYRFVLSDGSTSTDLLELADLKHARREAINFLSDAMRQFPDELWQDGSIQLLVQDHDGLTLLTLDTHVTNAPAANASLS